MKTIVIQIILILAVHSISYSQGGNRMLPIKENGKWGYYDFSISKVIIEPEYDEISTPNSWGIKTENDGKVGFINLENELVVKPQYKGVKFINLDYVLVESFENKKGILKNETGEIAVPLGDYDDIKAINKKFFNIKKGDKWGLVSLKGKELVPCEYLGFGASAEENFIPFVDDIGRFGILQINNNKITVPPAFNRITPKNGTYSTFIKGKSKGIINHIDNKIIIQGNYKSITFITKDRAVLEHNENGSVLYSLKDEKTIPIENAFDRFIPFNDKYFIVCKGNKRGMINMDGESILENEFTYIRDVENHPNLLELKKGDYIGIYDFVNKKEIIPFEYKKLVFTDEGLIQVANYSGNGIYNKNFNLILEPIYTGISIKDNVIKARKDKGVKLFRLDDNQNIEEEDEYKEYYSLKIGYRNSSILAEEPQNTQANNPDKFSTINFPEVLFEWIDESGSDGKEAYKKIGEKDILSDFVYHSNHIYKTHFFTVKTRVKKENNELFSYIFEFSNRLKPIYLFDGNKGEFLSDSRGFLGFRFSDFTNLGLPYMTTILDNGKFSMVNLKGEFLEHDNEIFKATYISEPHDGMIAFAIEGEWTGNKNTVKLSNEHINLKKLGKQFNLDLHSNYSMKYNKAIYLKDAKWGYMDYHGNIIIPPIYEYAFDFKSERAIVIKDNKRGVIDKKNKIIIPLAFDDIKQKRNNYFKVSKNNNDNIEYLLNNKGEQLISKPYEFTGRLVENKRRIKENGKYGVVNEKGKNIIPAKYDSLGIFHQGYALARMENDIFIIDKNGKEYLKNKNFEIKGSVRNGLIRIKENGK